MIRKIGAYLMLVCTVAACSSPSEKVIYERLVSGEFDAYHYLPTQDINLLIQDSLQVFKVGEEVFTGVGVRTISSEDFTLEKIHIYKGQLHGYHQFYSPDGLLLELLYNQGEPISMSYERFALVNQDSVLYQDTTLTRAITIPYYFKDSSFVKATAQFTEGVLSCLSFFDAKDSLITEKEIPSFLLQVEEGLPLED